MRFYILRILPTILLVTLAACGRGSNERLASGAGQAALPAPTAQDIPYSSVRRVTVSELRDALNDGSAIAVDTRHFEEYQARAIKGAVYIDALNGDPRLRELARDKLVVTYCSCPTEVTSARVALELKEKGFSNVAALLGGYDAWDDARLPTGPSGKEDHKAWQK
jgi:rhodanese-related sulfurtransferase